MTTTPRAVSEPGSEPTPEVRVEPPGETDTMPPVLRRPDPVADPAPVAQLRSARQALLLNPNTSLDEEAANVVTAGAVDPSVLCALVEARGETAEDTVSLLVPKPIVGGTLFAVAPHRRFADLDVLPDFINQRWMHLLPTAMDRTPPTTPQATYETLRISGDGAERPLAVFTVRMKDRKALAEAVTESMRRTHNTPGKRNDYTLSVLQQGVKEPLTLFLVRVVYDDDVSETYLVTGDGNSRLVSMWLARTGGDIDAAAAACVAAIIGPTDRTGQRRPADQRAARRNVAEMASRARRGLAEPTLTEATRREGHTLAFPATVVVGAQTEDGSRLPDLVAARDDLLANLHGRVTPWDDGAQNTQGMRRVYRHAHTEGLIKPEVHQVLSGTAGPQEMHELLGIPAHRLWSAAVHQHAVLAGPHAGEMNKLIRQEFGMGKADRQRVSEHLAPMALSAYRSSEGVEHQVRTFGNTGTITDMVWKRPWELTSGTDPLAVLDDVLQRALAGHPDAVAELTVLGGTAAILDGYITRERGSKEGTVRDSRHAPFRATPHRLLTILSSTAGGLRMLHSIARAHVAADHTVLPKQFHTLQGEQNGSVVHDGDPVMDKAGTQITIDYEWDLVYGADPALADETIASNKSTNTGAGTGSTETTREDVLQRRRLDQGLTDARKAANTLARMVPTRGREVFGSPETIDDLRDRLRKIDEILVAYGPARTAVLVLEDEDEDGDE